MAALEVVVEPVEVKAEETIMSISGQIIEMKAGEREKTT